MEQTLWAKEALTETGWLADVRVVINQGQILSVTPNHSPEGYRVGLLLPAPSNLHSHAFQRAMAGLTERRGPGSSDSFWTWRRLMYRFLAHLDPEDIEAISAFVQMEMAEAGYGAVAEFHYLHHQPSGLPYDNIGEMSERVVAAAAVTGLGLTLLPVLYQRGGCDGRDLGPGQVRFGNSVDTFIPLVDAADRALAALPPDSRLGIAVHSLRAVPKSGLDTAIDLAAGRPFHMHLAEQIAEVEEVEAHLGARPGEWLFSAAEVGPSWCLIHCTQMQPHEIAALATTGAVAGLCPITEANLGDGIFEGDTFYTAGGRFGIGSDSNIRISLSEELRMLEYSQRLRDRVRVVFARPDRSTGRILIETVAQGGAQATGRDSGVIAPGKLADLVALDTGAAGQADRQGDTALDSYIFTGDDRMVCDVWSAGRHIVQAGRHFAADAILARYRKTMAKLANVL